MIKFNEITWYSRLLSFIVFLALLPMIAFHIGTEYEKTLNVFGQIALDDEGSTP